MRVSIELEAAKPAGWLPNAMTAGQCCTMFVMNVNNILAESMYWAMAIGSLLITIGSGFQAVSAISAYQVELAESGLKDLFDLYVDPLRAQLQGKDWLKPTLKLLNLVNVVRVVFKVAVNINKLLKIPATEGPAPPAAQSPAILDTTAAGATVAGKIAIAALTDETLKTDVMDQIATEANQNTENIQAARIDKAARIRQLLLTGTVWMIIMYGSFLVLAAAGIQLYLYYTS